MSDATLIIELVADAERIAMAVDDDTVLELLKEKRNDLLVHVDYD